MCTCETLGSKFNLENQQNVLQQGFNLLMQIGQENSLRSSKKQSKGLRSLGELLMILKTKSESEIWRKPN